MEKTKKREKIKTNKTSRYKRNAEDMERTLYSEIPHGNLRGNRKQRKRKDKEIKC